MGTRSLLALMVGALAATSCRTPQPLTPAASRSPRPRAAVPGRPPALNGQVEKVREELTVTPLEVVFSGVRGEPAKQESVGIRNTGAEPVQLAGVELVGRDAALFQLVDKPPVPMTLFPASSVALSVSFAPPADAAPGVRRARIRVLVGPRADDGPPVDVSGLVTAGRMGDFEPPLGQVLDALGFRVRDGAGGLRLGNAPAPVGNELAARHFRRAHSSPVALYPVARFSGDHRIPYGYYPTGAPGEAHQLAVIAAGQSQTLNPDAEPEGKTTFDPGPGDFGLYESWGRRTFYTDDSLNTSSIKHAARIFPLESRTGGAIADAYAIAFEDDGGSDYQDTVFIIWNVTAVP
jgi:hypothetical protein